LSFRVRRASATTHRATPRGGAGAAPRAIRGRGFVHRVGDERIEGDEVREPTEIPIGRPQFPDAVQLADGGDARVVHERANRVRDPGRTGKRRPVVGGLTEHDEAGGRKPTLDLTERAVQWRWGTKHA